MSENEIDQGTGGVPVVRRESAKPERGWPSALLVLAMLYVFIAAINMMGCGLKTAAQDPGASGRIDQILGFADDPLVGLCVGILVTSIVQSSSFTTSLVVTLVASGQMSLTGAIPIVMGANIGTSITAVLVSLGHIRRRREFRLALSGAATHSAFKILAVGLLFPLELACGFLSVPAEAAGRWLGQTRAFHCDPGQFNVVKSAVAPLPDGLQHVLVNVLGLSKPWAGGLIAVIAMVLLFVSLLFLVVGLKGVLMQRVGSLFRRVLFARPWTGFGIGVIVTALVQSSSVTTSLAVPLLGTGVLQLWQVYPYILGADIGTTVTAILASLASAATVGEVGDPTAASLGLAVAAAHLLFNVCGVAVFWPLKRVPMTLGKRFAAVASRRRLWVVVAAVGLFFWRPRLRSSWPASSGRMISDPVRKG